MHPTRSGSRKRMRYSRSDDRSSDDPPDGVRSVDALKEALRENLYGQIDVSTYGS
jgi:hypothetical protein